MVNIKDKYKKLFIKIKKVTDDNETSHILQDKIYREYYNYCK